MTITNVKPNSDDARPSAVPPPVPPRGATPAPLVPDDVVDQIVAKADAEGLELLGPGELLTDLTKRILERALDEELTDELGYERSDAAGCGSGNSRNGTSPKTVLTELCPVEFDSPRDCNGSFEPQLISQA